MSWKTFVRIVLVLTIVIKSQDSQAQKFDSILTKLDAQYPQEKLYLQLDKEFYNPGETVWFKAYLFSGAEPSNISKNVYAELVDEKGKVLARKISPVITSGAASAFDLPVDLSSSILYVRAYTRWMLNFDSSYLFMKPIRIISNKEATAQKAGAAPQAKPAADKPAAAASQSQTLLDFFPEGGDMVQGIESRIAFKATDKRGHPVVVKGDVLDKKGTKVAELSAQHDGMGFFSLSPEAGDQYKAVWKDADGKPQQTNLPVAKPTGVTLACNVLSNGIQFSVKKSPSLNVNAVYIVAQAQQKLLYRAKGKLDANNIISGLIPTEGLPAGIVQVTAFTEDEKPLAERIVFVNRNDYYFITDLNMPLKNFGKRGRNVIQVDVPDTIGCNLSISVTDADINPANKQEDDIFSHLLLSSDIKGYVHNPAYYFASEADSVVKHLDLVMMTNGWRRFKWEDVLAGKYPALTNAPEEYLGIEGKITGLSKTEMQNREITGFLSINGNDQFISIPMTPDGRVSLPGLIFFDTVKLFYQFNNDKNKVLTSKALFDFKNNLLVKPLINRPVEYGIMAAQPPEAVIARNKLVAQRAIAQIEENKKVQTLASVEVVAKQKSKKDKMNEDYTSGLFRGDDGYTFITEDDPFANSSLSVLQYLQGKVAGLQITVSGPNASLSWRGGTPALYMNEMQSDVSMIQSLPMTDVAMVKVFRPPFLGGFGGGSGGAIAVYTKKGKAANENVKGLDFAKIPGYTPTKEFYSPDYSKAEPSHSLDDLRNTILWRPYILTDANNRRILFTFYNSDITKKYRVIIEGINVEGKLTRMEKVFE